MISADSSSHLKFVAGNSLPSHADHTRCHQLLHTDPHLRVLHVLLQSRRVALRLLQNALHDGVLEDRHDLVGH